MSIDEHVKILLEKMAALSAPKMWDVGPKAARAAMRSSIFRRHNEPIGKTEDRAIAGPGGPIALRVYTPLHAQSDLLPGLAYFHGGGFVLGDLETHDGICRALANESGCRTIAVDYRLAPEHRFPAAVEDAYAATVWMAQNAQSLGIDAARLAVGGDSAGGNLAAVMAQIAKQQGAPALAYQLLIYPVMQLGSDSETQSMRANANGYFLERESMAWFTRCYAPDLKDRGDPRLSPLLCKDLAGLPPAYVVTAGHDPLHDEGRDYATALNEAGVPVTYVDYPGMIHGFFNFRDYIPKAKEAVVAAGAALRVALAADA
jgi:acetyl esterase